MSEVAINLKQPKVFKVKKFFFPFTPIRPIRSLRLLILIAVLIALKAVLTVTSISIKPFSLSISISWVPVIVLGWYFGPIAGLFIGIITDTMSFLITGGVWFWMYAIQEPIVAFIAGCIGGFYRFRKEKEKRNIITDIAISQFFTLFFAACVYFILLVWLKPGTNFSGYKQEYNQFYSIYKWTVLGLLLGFIILYETLVILNLKNKIKTKSFDRMLTYIYTSSCVIFMVLLFSFALGPTVAVEYIKFINGGLTPTNYLKYGSIFYLVPRVAVEAIKAPIELAVVFGAVTILDKGLKSTINKINCSYNN